MRALTYIYIYTVPLMARAQKDGLAATQAVEVKRAHCPSAGCELVLLVFESMQLTAQLDVCVQADGQGVHTPGTVQVGHNE